MHNLAGLKTWIHRHGVHADIMTSLEADTVCLQVPGTQRGMVSDMHVMLSILCADRGVFL